MMVTQFSCTCGNNDPKKVYEYDGALGYEALVCTVCGAYYDHVGSGAHLPDEWSRQFVGGETRPSTINFYNNMPQAVKDMAEEALAALKGKMVYADEVNLDPDGWTNCEGPVKIKGTGWAEYDEWSNWLDVRYEVEVPGLDDPTAYVNGQSIEVVDGEIKGQYTDLRLCADNVAIVPESEIKDL